MTDDEVLMSSNLGPLLRPYEQRDFDSLEDILLCKGFVKLSQPFLEAPTETRRQMDFERNLQDFLKTCGIRPAKTRRELAKVLRPAIEPVIEAALEQGTDQGGPGLDQSQLTSSSAKANSSIGGVVRDECTSLPKLPKGLSWPDETYKNSAECKLARCKRDSRGGIVSYLRRVWVPLIQRGVPVTLPVIRAIDKTAGKAIDKYTERKDPTSGRRRAVPFEIPTRHEVTDRKIRSAGGVVAAIAAEPHLTHTIISRIRRGSPVPGLK